jgi:hypothetical protein
MPNREDLNNAIHTVCAQLRGAVIFDPLGEVVLDSASGKTAELQMSRIERWENRKDRVTGRPYLVLLRDDATQVVLSEHGVAFEPLRDHVPPGIEVPPVVCMADFRRLLDRLAHQLHGHADESPTRELVELAMVSVGILGGARRVGFNVDREERELEPLLRDLESRAPPAH